MLISETRDIQTVRNNALNSGPVDPDPYEAVNGKGQNICIHTPDKLLPHNESTIIVEDEIVPSIKVPTKWQPSETFLEFLHPQKAVNGKGQNICIHTSDKLLPHNESAIIVEDEIVPSLKVPTKFQPSETFLEFLQPQKAANCAAEAPLNDSDNCVIPGLEQLFSPQLSDRDWQKQLAILQARNASVGGIPFSEFSRINVVKAVDLPKSHRVIRSADADKEAPAEKGLMTVFYGTLETTYVSWLYPGDTLVGSRARIAVGDRTVSLSLPATSVITPGPSWDGCLHGFSGGVWDLPMPGGNELRKVRDDTSYYLPTSMTDPVLKSFGGNVIGVEIHCLLSKRHGHKNYLCGIHANGIGERISLCDNIINNYDVIGIGVYDASTTIASNNTFTAYAAGDAHRAVVVSKCAHQITDNNEVSVMPGGENRPSKSHPDPFRKATEVYVPGLGHSTLILW